MVSAGDVRRASGNAPHHFQPAQLLMEVTKDRVKLAANVLRHMLGGRKEPDAVDEPAFLTGQMTDHELLVVEHPAREMERDPAHDAGDAAAIAGAAAQSLDYRIESLNDGAAHVDVAPEFGVARKGVGLADGQLKLTNRIVKRDTQSIERFQQSIIHSKFPAHPYGSSRCSS